MNEKIIELAKQANVTYGQIGHKYSKSLYMASEKELEKFAELIVKECIAVLDLDDGATLRSELLAEHFGVK